MRFRVWSGKRIFWRFLEKSFGIGFRKHWIFGNWYFVQTRNFSFFIVWIYICLYVCKKSFRTRWWLNAFEKIKLRKPKELIKLALILFLNKARCKSYLQFCYSIIQWNLKKRLRFIIILRKNIIFSRMILIMTRERIAFGREIGSSQWVCEKFDRVLSSTCFV